MSMAQCFLFPWSQRLLQTNLECSPLQKYFCILIFFSMITTFEFEIFVIMLYAIVNIGDQLNISRLHLDCSIRHVAPPGGGGGGGGAACPALTLCKCNNYQINLLCYSSFPFFICLYCMGSESELSKHCLNSIKKKTMQIISLASFDAHILPMFTELRIIKFLDLISCNSLFIYKHFPSKSPSVLQMFLFWHLIPWTKH